MVARSLGEWLLTSYSSSRKSERVISQIFPNCKLGGLYREQAFTDTKLSNDFFCFVVVVGVGTWQSLVHGPVPADWKKQTSHHTVKRRSRELVKNMLASKLCRISCCGLVFLVLALGAIVFRIPGRIGLNDRVFTSNPAYVGALPAFASEWGYTFEQLYQNDLTGQTALVTGANSGVGYEIALALARLGATVTLACRNPTKCTQAADQIRSDERVTKGHVRTMQLDTTSLTSVKLFAQRYKKETEKLDMLFLNAGIGSAGFNEDGSAPLSEDGIEMVFATNHVGHFLLYKLLEPLLMKSMLARVVLTSSSTSYATYAGHRVATDIETLNGARPANFNDQYAVTEHKLCQYGQSKLSQILFAAELTRRLGPKSNIFVNAAHPGTVNTNIWSKSVAIPPAIRAFFDYVRRMTFWSGAEGALTLLYLGVATDELVGREIRGKYFHPQVVEMKHCFVYEDETLQRRVWAFSEDLVKGFV